MNVAITALRERLPVARPISVVHTDLPENDFSSLYRWLESDPASYLRTQSNVFTSAVGRSFYERLFPDNYVSLGWSAYAVTWPSRTPALIPGHFYITRSTGAVLQVFDQRAEQDWEVFLSHRARELRRGGRLLVLTPGRGDDGLHGTEPLMDQVNAVLTEMVNDGFITSEERERIVLPAPVRNKSDLMAPFLKTGAFQGLVVEYCDVSTGPDAAWTGYQEHRDPNILARQHAGFVRATFGPTLASALDGGSAGNRAAAFIERLKKQLISRVAITHADTNRG